MSLKGLAGITALKHTFGTTAAQMNQVARACSVVSSSSFKQATHLSLLDPGAGSLQKIPRLPSDRPDTPPLLSLLPTPRHQVSSVKGVTPGTPSASLP